jgi:hypothetical protein
VFNVYRDSLANPPIATSLLGTTYTDTGLTAGNSHSYWVVARVTNGGSNYSIPASATPSPVFVNSCGANLTTSDIDVTFINSIAQSGATQCNKATNAGALNFREKQTLTFQINLCNSGTTTTTEITVIDQLINLQMPSAGWQACLNSNCSYFTYDGVNANPIANHYSIASGNAPNQQLKFNLGSHEILTGGTSRLTFKADLPVIASASTSGSRWQTGIRVDFKKDLTTFDFIRFSTPLIRYVSGKNEPNIVEGAF